jgi:hypothetical protein
MQSELKSKRLILIQSDVSHASDLFSFWTDPEVSKFMNMESLSTQDEVIDMIEFTNQLAALNQSIRYTVFLKESNQKVTDISFSNTDAFIDKNGFEDILVELALKFERLKPLARELQKVIFPIKDRAIFIGTFQDYKIMYDGLISAFDMAIADIVER